METKTYSIQEVIRFTAVNLKKINIPAEYAEQIGMPVLNAIRNLKAVQQVLEAQEVAEEIQDDPVKPEEGENNG